jgi:hypothetical protein
MICKKLTLGNIGGWTGGNAIEQKNLIGDLSVYYPASLIACILGALDVTNST